ncbi:MAG TPA: energy transducer TonB, partial [Anaeromyxobacteraceae bacterium]|nr:energy transducer TonB [Anaeromyxobacteraceae bacterium]
LTGDPAEGAPVEAPEAIPFRQAGRRIFTTLFGEATDPAVQGEVAAMAVQQGHRVLFDAMVAREGGRRVARRSAWTVGAATFQVAFVSSLMLLTAALAARSQPDPEVQVKLVQPVFQRPAPPPPAPPKAVRRAPAAPRPNVATVKPHPPAALVQPREIAEAMKAPDPNEPVEEYEVVEGEGVEGGVVGGVPAYAPPPTEGGGIMEAPQYVTTGFRAPAEAVGGCVRSSVRLPTELAGYVAGQVVVKFAVGRDGSVGLVQLMTPVPDPRIAAAIRNAIEACRWRAGSDAQGRPVTLWVILPLRFTSG